MSTTFAGLPRTLGIALMWAISTAGYGAHAQRSRSQAPPDAVPSQLLSDDERIDFCTQMHRASTPEERRAVAARMRDTLTPRAKVQGVALPPWLLEGRPANESGAIPGLSCEAGAARPHVQAPAPVRQPPERKPPPREVAARQPPAPAVPVRQLPAQPVQPAQSVPAPPVSREAPSARNTTAGDIPVEQDHGVAYVTGGVGQDEATAIRGMASSYNMRAMFTTRSGEYLSGVSVQIFRSDGTPVFTATSDGPYLFARLPQGHYRLVATVDGSQRSRELYIPARGGVRFTLVWPALHATSSN
jgi:hypothetical protein